jgi:hypothetical protein
MSGQIVFLRVTQQVLILNTEIDAVYFLNLGQPIIDEILFGYEDGTLVMKLGFM